MIFIKLPLTLKVTDLEKVTQGVERVLGDYRLAKLI